MVPREQLLGTIEKFDDEQIEEMLRFAQLLLDEAERSARYDPTKDPMLIGETLFEGAPDLAERVEDILYGDYQPTAKDES